MGHPLAKTYTPSCFSPRCSNHLTDSLTCWGWVLSRKTTKHFLNGAEIGLGFRKVSFMVQALFRFTGRTLLVPNYWPNIWSTAFPDLLFNGKLGTIICMAVSQECKLSVTKTVFSHLRTTDVFGPSLPYLPLWGGPKVRFSKQSLPSELCLASPSYKESQICQGHRIENTGLDPSKYKNLISEKGDNSMGNLMVNISWEKI